MDEEILKFIRERGILLEKEMFDMLNGINNPSTAKGLLEGLERYSGQKMINSSVLNKNFSFVRNFMNKLPGDDKQEIEKVIIKLGLSLEVRKETEIIKKDERKKEGSDFKIFYSTTSNEKKLEVADFVGNFRSRYQQIQKIIMLRPDLNNLVSINKISNERKNYTIIGILSEKRITKNKNLIMRFEDLTGEISVLVKNDKREVFSKAEELLLDDIVAIKASGSREMLFANDILFPDSFVGEKIRFDGDINIAFLSDIHVGGSRFLERGFENFLEWINGDNPDAKKIKYIFISGDNVDGVGVFPGQEFALKIKSINNQYDALAGYLKRIPKHITIFMCPGQHDATRVAEPQPIISKRYAPALYEIDNLILVSNPTYVKLIENEKEFTVLMYHGDAIHTFMKEIPELRTEKLNPAKAVRHMLKRRHLFPFHSEAIYIPNKDKDNLVITEVPDILCTGEVHRVDIENYNGTLIMTGSCWQGQTPFEEKVGNIPDPCKLPVFNLKSRELKILDFSVQEEIESLHRKL